MPLAPERCTTVASCARDGSVPTTRVWSVDTARFQQFAYGQGMAPESQCSRCAVTNEPYKPSGSAHDPTAGLRLSRDWVPPSTPSAPTPAGRLTAPKARQERQDAQRWDTDLLPSQSPRTAAPESSRSQGTGSGASHSTGGYRVRSPSTVFTSSTTASCVASRMSATESTSMISSNTVAPVSSVLSRMI